MSSNNTNVGDYDKIIIGGPMADSAAVDQNSWAKKIKTTGSLKMGGSDSDPLYP